MPFDPKGSEKEVERFVASYLKVDGVFILRMINSHAGIIFGTDLVLSLWRAFYGIEEKRRRGTGTSLDLTPSTASPSAPLEEKDNKLNFVRLRNRRPSGDKKAGVVEKALQQQLIPQTTQINKAIVMPSGDPVSDEDIDAENRSDEETTPSEESANFHASPTISRGQSHDKARLIEEGKKEERPAIPPKPVSMKKTQI